MTTAGATITLAAATAGGDSLVATPRTFLFIKNAGSQMTVTISATVASVNLAGAGDIPVASIAVVVPATTGEKLIPIPPLTHSAGGLASITYTSVTSLTVAAVRIPNI
jgi:hypothetical protein